MDDLRQIDLFERIRQHVLTAWPGAEDALRRLAEESGVAAQDRETETLLATLLKIASTGAAAHRRVLQIREALASNDDETIAAHGLSPAQIARARRGLTELAALHAEHGTARGWASGFDGPADLLVGIRRTLPALRGQDRWRFLRGVGAAVVVPERRRQALLTRLGLLRTDEDTDGATGWAAQHEVSAHLAHLAAEPLALVDFVLGAFAGGEPGPSPKVALCARTPMCARCPVSSLCDYHHHHGDAVPAPPATLKNLPEADRPREKLAMRGAEALTDTELLAIVLRSGAAGGGTALDLAARLLARFESAAGMAKTGLGELCQVSGVGPAKAAEILAALEIGRRASAAPQTRGAQWASSEEIYQAMAPRMATLEHEEFRLLLLDTRLRLIREVVVSRGDLTGTTVHPREIFKQAIRESAAAFIAVHNHPSGDPTPSHEDRMITNQLRDAGEIVGIRLLDHLVIAAEGHVSFADRGWL